MSEVTTLPIKLTDNALTEIHAIRERESLPDSKVLRIGVKGGGCSGLSYVLDFDEVTDFDDRFEIDGLTLVVDKRHTLYINDMEVDFQRGLNDRGFVFINPNAKSTCGCGTSFSA